MAQLLSNLPLGAKIKLGTHQINSETALPIIWMIVDKNHSGYPSNSVTLMTERIIDQRAFDGKEPSWDDSIDTTRGYSSYVLSNLHQWLNSEGAAGAWWTESHLRDKDPNSSTTLYGTSYSNRPGFLYNFTANERASLLPTTLINQRGTSASSSFVAKVFLPGIMETIGVAPAANDGTTRFAYFNSSTAQALPTQQLVTNTLADTGYKPTSTSAYWEYWTRNAGTSSVDCVSKTGSSASNSAYNGSIGVRPCVNISSTTKITDTTDSDGCYTILTNVVPTISGSNSNLGTKPAAFSQTYSVSDGDSDPVTVTEYIDNVQVRSYVATLGATNTFSVTGATWLKLVNGAHTLKIVATDGFGEAVRTYNFTKSVTTLVVQRSTPLASTTQPKSILVTVVKVIPDGATFKVEACNNGYDTSPTWEDITTRVVQGRIYDFTNTTKTASAWGVNVRVTVGRNGAEGACYITEIGGNFE